METTKYTSGKCLSLNLNGNYLNENGFNTLLVEFKKDFSPYRKKIIERATQEAMNGEPIDIEFIENIITKFFHLKNIKIPYISLGYDLIVLLDSNLEKGLSVLFDILQGLYGSADLGNLPLTKNGELVIDYKDSKYIVNFYFNENDRVSVTNTIISIKNIEDFTTNQLEIVFEKEAEIENLKYIRDSFFDIVDILKFNSTEKFNTAFKKEGMKKNIDFIGMVDDLYDFVVTYKESLLKDDLLKFVYYLIYYIEENLKSKCLLDFLTDYNFKLYNWEKTFREIRITFYFFIENKLNKKA